MLPDPKDVAKTINRIFRNREERQQDVEFNRDVQVRMGKTRLKRHLANQKNMVIRLKALAKRALSLNNETKFRQVGRQLLWTQQDIQRWEQYLLSLEVLEARRDQARASVDLIKSVKAMSDSLSDLAAPGQMSELQRDLEEGLARASSLEERMAVMMDVMDSTLTADMVVDESALTDLEDGLTDEIAQQEAAMFDEEIEASLSKIRDELESKGK